MSMRRQLARLRERAPSPPTPLHPDYRAADAERQVWGALLTDYGAMGADSVRSRCQRAGFDPVEVEAVVSEVASVYDGLTAAYREGWTEGEAAAELHRQGYARLDARKIARELAEPPSEGLQQARRQSMGLYYATRPASQRRR